LILTRLTAIAFALCAVVPATAQEVTGVTVVEHGLYTAEVVSSEVLPNGIGRATLRNICHVVTTRSVPALMNVMFGFRFIVEGAPQGEVIELRRVTRYPVPMKPLPSRPPVLEYDHTFGARIGVLSYIGYGFDHAWELQTGPWTLELWYGQRKLAEQVFEIVERGERPAPPTTSDSNCFQLSSL